METKRKKRRKKLTPMQLGQRRRRRREKREQQGRESLVHAADPAPEVFQTLGAARTLLAGVGHDKDAAKQVIDWLKNGQPDSPIYIFEQGEDDERETQESDGTHC